MQEPSCVFFCEIERLDREGFLASHVMHFEIRGPWYKPFRFEAGEVTVYANSSCPLS